MPANSSTVYGRRPGHARGISKGNDVIIEEPRNFQDNAWFKIYHVNSIAQTGSYGFILRVNRKPGKLFL